MVFRLLLLTSLFVVILNVAVAGALAGAAGRGVHLLVALALELFVEDASWVEVSVLAANSPRPAGLPCLLWLRYSLRTS